MPHTGRARVVLRATSKVLINAAVFSDCLSPRGTIDAEAPNRGQNDD
jgi:hypothetical protein